MKKKLLFVVVFISFVVGLFFVSSANDNSNGLYISTEACPENYIQFAAENLPHFILAEDPSVALDSVSVGSPFAFYGGGSDLFYFPVMVDGVIEYLFRAYPGTDGLCGAITRFLAEDLEELSDLTSAQNPLTLRMINNQIVGVIGDQQYVLYTYPEDLSNSGVEAAQFNSVEYTVIDAKQESDMELRFIQSRDVYRYLYLDMLEQQPSGKSWCAAYATAAIMRYTIGCSVTARDIMDYFYDNNPSSTDIISRSQVIEYGQWWVMDPQYAPTNATNQLFITEIENNRPVYWSMKRYISSSNSYGYHAVVLCGYNYVGGSTWRIWNPWYDYYETYTMGGTYVPTTKNSSDYSYTYNGAIYNWVDDVG